MDWTELSVALLSYATAIGIAVELIIRCAPDFFKKTVIGQRLLHPLPLLVGALGVFLYPEAIPGKLPGPPVFWGIMAGTLSGHAYALFKRQRELTGKGVSTVQDSLEMGMELVAKKKADTKKKKEPQSNKNAPSSPVDEKSDVPPVSIEKDEK